MLKDARVASLRFFKDNVCTTRINKEKKFKIKFQVLLKFPRILPDYKLVLENEYEIVVPLFGAALLTQIVTTILYWFVDQYQRC